MKTIRLYGHLGKMFGKTHTFDVSDSLDALRALSANFPKFKQEFAKFGRAYQVIVNNAPVIEGHELLLPAHEIKFIPVVTGAGNGIGSILLGAALIVASFYVPSLAEMAGVTLSATTTTLIAGAVFSFGTSLALGGMAQMLSQSPQQDSKNFGFSGPVNNTNQGNVVPILYGNMIVGSQVISASVVSQDIPIADSAVVTANVVNYKGQY